MSCTVDFDTDEYYLTQLSGSWARERQVVHTRLLDGITAFQRSVLLVFLVLE